MPGNSGSSGWVWILFVGFIVALALLNRPDTIEMVIHVDNAENYKVFKTEFSNIEKPTQKEEILIFKVAFKDTNHAIKILKKFDNINDFFFYIDSITADPKDLEKLKTLKEEINKKYKEKDKPKKEDES